MPVHKMTFSAWGDACARFHGKPSYDNYMGSSPGAAAVSLNVSRQRISSLVHEGLLDKIELSDEPGGQVTAHIITDASLKRCLKARK